MWVVIFQATVAVTDEEYAATAARLRDLALNEFGCLKFVSMMEGDQELALSWWPDEESIYRWKSQADHLMAQQLGRERWYSSYHVQITKVQREYMYNNHLSS